MTTYTPAGAAVSGSFDAVEASAAFTPDRGRPVRVLLSGTFVATVQLERSTDGGDNWYPVTVGGQPWGVFTGACNEPVDEASGNETYRLNCTAFTSGEVDYRLGH